MRGWSTIGAWALTAASIAWLLAATVAAAYAAEEQLAPFSWTVWQTRALVAVAAFGAVAVALTARRGKIGARTVRQPNSQALRVGTALLLLGLILSVAFLPAIALSAIGAIVLVHTRFRTSRVR